LTINAKSLLRGTFRTGIAAKGIDGVLETAGGVLLWFVKPSSFVWVQTLWFNELARDPHDYVAAHLLRVSEMLVGGDPVFASLYLLSHGLVKLVLAAALWLDRLWAYPAAIFVFGGFCVYQVYRYTYTHSAALLWLTVFDLAVVYLTWQEYRVLASARKAGSAPVSKPQIANS
jgi:uncharacterized membrane protein